MLALLLAYALISRPSLDLTGISFFSFFEFGTIAYLLVFVVVAMSSRSLTAAFLEFFPGGTTAPLYFLRVLVLAFWALSWGVSVGTAFNLMKGLGASQLALVPATFVR